MTLEQREIFYSIRIELEKLKQGGFVIPDIVSKAIDNLELEYDK